MDILAFVKSIKDDAGFASSFSDSVTGDISIIDGVNIEYRKYLRNYSFTEFILTILSSSIKDSLGYSEFSIILDDNPEIQGEVNKFLKEINLKETMFKDLNNILFYGTMYYEIVDNKIYRIKDSDNYTYVNMFGSLYGFLKDNQITLVNDLQFVYFFDKYITNTVSIEETKFKNNEEYQNLNPKSIMFEYIIGKSIFDSHLKEMFTLHILETLLRYNSIMSEISPIIMSANIQGHGMDEDITNMSNSIESILNSLQSGLLSGGPNQIMNSLVDKLFQRYLVVPVANGTFSIDQLEVEDHSSKRSELKSEIEDLRNKILHAFTIPEELYGGMARRMESLARSETFTDTINNLISSIFPPIKLLCKNYIKNTYRIDLDLSEIKISNEGKSSISSAVGKNKITSISETVEAIESLMRTSRELIDSDLVKGDQMLSWLHKKISDVDETLSTIIVENLNKEDNIEDV